MKVCKIRKSCFSFIHIWENFGVNWWRYQKQTCSPFQSDPWLVGLLPWLVACSSSLTSFFFFSRAVGHMMYGTAYREQIVDKLRKAAEHCDCLQCFFLIHSMGGGKTHDPGRNLVLSEGTWASKIGIVQSSKQEKQVSCLWTTRVTVRK